MNKNTQHVLSLEENTQGRDFVVSDIHGSFDLLEKALHEVRFNPEKDRLISVGDLVNYGPDSIKGIEYLKKPWFFHLKGNHETMVMEAYKDGKLNEERIEKDRKNRLQWLRNASKEELEFMASSFAKLPTVIEVNTSEGAVGFVHGDVPKGLDWESFKKKISRGDSLTLEAAVFSRTKIKSLNDNEVKGVRRVFLGHTPLENGPVALGNCFFIDTGAVFKHINKDNPQNLYMTLADIKANAEDICEPRRTMHPLVKIANADNEEEEYRRALKGHDWFYNYSDDHRVWKKGQAHSSKISSMRKKLDPDYSIWNAYAPDMFQVKPRPKNDNKPSL